jgi:hypothetical protein
MLESDRIDILVEDEGDGDHEVEDVEALSAKVERQNLNGVRDDERCKGETKHEEQRESAGLTSCKKPI